jgi:hypothetical protein
MLPSCSWAFVLSFSLQLGRLAALKTANDSPARPGALLHYSP